MLPSTSLEVLEFEQEDYSLQREARCTREAKANGLDIFSGDEHTLVFDLDSEDAYLLFMERADFLRDKFAMIRLVVTLSKSGNYHAVAYLDPLLPGVDAVLRLAIQACLGSDWKKEMLGVLRTINYQSSDSKLFRPKHLTVVYEWERAS